MRGLRLKIWLTSINSIASEAMDEHDAIFDLAQGQIKCPANSLYLSLLFWIKENFSQTFPSKISIS